MMENVIALLFPIKEGAEELIKFKEMDAARKVEKCREMQKKHGVTCIYWKLTDFEKSCNREEIDFSALYLTFIERGEETEMPI